jgi:multisubunit Na+/H+ antiporter MnhC subunit
MCHNHKKGAVSALQVLIITAVIGMALAAAIILFASKVSPTSEAIANAENEYTNLPLN